MNITITREKVIEILEAMLENTEEIANIEGEDSPIVEHLKGEALGLYEAIQVIKNGGYALTVARIYEVEL